MKHNRTVFFTGAGVSVASGLAPYRGVGGIWEREDVSFVGSAEGFRVAPDAAREHWRRMAEAVHAVHPNKAHEAIAANGGVVITQNVDGLHQAAGSPVVHELHGSLHRYRCGFCGEQGVVTDPVDTLAPCGNDCPGTRRPDVVLFGESLPSAPLWAARAAVQQCAHLFVVGTTLLVHPAAELPALARAAGAELVWVNTEAPPKGLIWDRVLLGKAEDVLQLLTLSEKSRTAGL